MGYANIENTLRDRVAEIICNSRRHPQALGEPNEKDYRLAEKILDEVEEYIDTLVLDVNITLY